MDRAVTRLFSIILILIAGYSFTLTRWNQIAISTMLTLMGVSLLLQTTTTKSKNLPNVVSVLQRIAVAISIVLIVKQLILG